MKTQRIAGLFAPTSFAAGSALTWGRPVAASGSGLSRAQVVAELAQAVAMGLLAFGKHAAKQSLLSNASGLGLQQVKQDVSYQARCASALAMRWRPTLGLGGLMGRWSNQRRTSSSTHRPCM